MKKKYTLLILFLAFIASVGKAEDKTINIVYLNGNNSKVETSVIDRIEVKDGAVVLYDKNDVNSNSYNVADIDYISLESITTGIKTIKNENQNSVLLIIGNDVITVEGASKGDIIEIYDTSGAKLSGVTCESGSAEVSIKGLKPGIYVTKIGNSSKKFIKH